MRRTAWMIGVLLVSFVAESQAGFVSIIDLQKTVITDSGVCPGVDPLVVPPNTNVRYCYVVTNNNTITYTAHTLQDDILGTLIGPSASFDLPPGGTQTFTSTAQLITADRMNVATWTAISDSTTATDTDSAKVFVGPVNDDCISATTVVITDTTSMPFMDMVGTITHATTEQSEPIQCGSCDYSAQHSVWYQLTPPTDGTVCAQTCDGNYDTVLGAFSGPCSALSEITCNDDFGHGCPNNGSAIAFPVTQGTPVFIRVSSCLFIDAGTLKLTVNYCGVDLMKTVSKDGQCPGSSAISVPSGTEVTYCFKLTNNSPITLTAHSLEDSVLGQIFNTGVITVDIPPGAMFITDTMTNVTTMVMNVATWTSSISDTINPPATVLTDTAKATVVICGDGVTDAPEDCDDSNTANGDCCSSMCMFETGSCSDGNACTQTDTCSQGQCVGSNPVVCDPPAECKQSGTCDPGTGTCSYPNQPDQTACTADANVCTTDVCVGGTCMHLNNSAPCAGDNNPCTGDVCSGGACTHPNNTGPCVNGSNGVTCFQSPGVCSGGACGPIGPDADGDGICDADDFRPSQFDPSGYIYDQNTGKIVGGGKVVVSRVGAGVGTIVMTADGSPGFYQYSVTGLGTEETYALAVTAPPGCVLSPTCVAQAGAFDPTGLLNPVALGSYPSGTNPAFLSSSSCLNNMFYLSFEFEAGDPDVINNNIPVLCAGAPAPAMSGWGLAAVCLALTAVAFFTLRRMPRPSSR